LPVKKFEGDSYPLQTFVHFNTDINTMLYSIPRHIKISDLNIKQYRPLSAHQQNAVAILKDNYSERNFFINASTKMFIEKFRTLKSFIAVNKEIAAETNIKIEEIRRYTAPFFDHLKKMGFIVKEGSSVNLKTRARFNKNKQLDEYKIEKCLDAAETTDVYIARVIGLQKKVIIKLLKQISKADNDQFKSEYNFLYTLNNSGVTPEVYAFKKEKNISLFCTGIYTRDHR
jgi:hypothetical protein